MKIAYVLRRSRKAAFLRGLVVAVLLGLLPLITNPAEAAIFTVQDGLIKLASPNYEVAFSAADGSISYILDKATGQNISDGNNENTLWLASPDHGSPISSTAYSGHFKYSYDAAQNKLTLTYTGTTTVTVTIIGSSSQSFKMQAVVTNNAGANISSFNFPHELRVVGADINDAMLPMMPGALLNANFFTKNMSFVDQYPGVMFADYLSIRSARGKIALYAQKNPVLQPVYMGYEHVSQGSPYTKMTHNFKTWIANTKTWSSPWVVVRVGQDYPETIASYRTDNGIDKFKSLATKLGKAAQAYFSAPMYKLDLRALQLSFDRLEASVIDKINVPGIVHFVAFQNGGHDKSYPDFIPPDPKWGTSTDFAHLVSAIHSKKGLAVPYTNFSWWDLNGATLTNLPSNLALPDVVAADASGSIIIEKYGPNAGLVVNLQNAFVQNKITEQHTALLNTVGVDGIFEDQWGARNAPYDFNSAGLKNADPSTSYFVGVLDHYRAHANSKLMTEVGVDVLADNGVGFMGTNYLWDILGYRGATAPYTSYYPMAAMLFRDKVLLYQHDLAAETWTKNKDMLRWNLSQGYSLSNAFYDQDAGGLNMDNPWLNLVGVFQKYALSHYADQLVVRFDDLGNEVKQTTFGTYKVTSNWSKANSFTLNGNVLPPGGVQTQANDGSVTAGVFTSYSGNALSSGEHYLVEVRSPTAIQVFQPVGADTTVHITVPNAENVKVTAYRYDNSPISNVTAAGSGNDLSFDYASLLNGQPVGYYQITATNGQPF